MDKLKDGFGLGIGAMLGIVAVVLLCICGTCAACLGLAVLGEAGQDGSSDLRLRPTRAVVELPPPPSQRENDAPEQTQSAAPPATVGLGQDTMAGNIRWKVLEAKDLGNKLQGDSQFVEPMETSGRFVQVRVEVENRGTEAAIFTDVNLVDNQGRKFEDSSDALIWFVADNERCVIEQLNPNLPKVCTMIFEVPLNATGLQFQAGDLDLFDDKEVLINLGL